jgi:hypothetical protein
MASPFTALSAIPIFLLQFNELVERFQSPRFEHNANRTILRALERDAELPYFIARTKQMGSSFFQHAQQKHRDLWTER